MNIDLLLTGQGEAGLVSDKEFQHAVAGVMFDAQTGLVTLEFGDAEPMELNIAVEQESGQHLIRALSIHVGAIEKGMIAENRQVPLVLLNDPFGGGNRGRFPVRPRSSTLAFENFMKNTVFGQPVHRDDLGDEAQAGSVLGGMSAAVLQFAPHLARQRTMEASPQLRHEIAPPTPGFGPRGAGTPSVRRIQNTRPADEAEGEE